MSYPDELMSLMAEILKRDKVQSVWEKGFLELYLDPSQWRRDAADYLIKRSEYGNRSSEYGWEIDHIDPSGPDELRNLQPLLWRANVWKSNRAPIPWGPHTGYPTW